VLTRVLFAQCACGERCFPPSPPSIWPVRVVDYAFGTSQTFGQDSRYFPYNVLGPICTTATPTRPCADPCQVVSLGKGGYITLEFDPPIVDGPGPDFVVFENAFFYGNGQVFEEWMIVEVSQDGQNWRVFPYDSVTGAGLAGRTPTGCGSCSGEISWQDPAEAGGDAFDLAQVALGWVRWVRVRDATHWQPSDRLSADLDGLVAIHQLSPTALEAQTNLPFWQRGNHLFVRSVLSPSVEAWDFLGRRLPVTLAQIGNQEWEIQIPVPAVVRLWIGGRPYGARLSGGSY
jgi:hypothetical protein